MSDFAIRVQHVSKCYQVYDNPRDRLKQFISSSFCRIFGKHPPQYFNKFLALKDINFEVKKGETVGIVGRNGSGKSTLLQIICGTLNPTSGTVETVGRVAALLELGSGFNPEFTGRENVFLNAAVLGLSQKEIEMRFNDIASFADIGAFIEQPVKTYSSGMMMRLAFAVAINSDPEILIIDEALSVGDELFQRKCFSRLESIRANGATILFVSHIGNQVVQLCDRALLMDGGESLIMGLSKYVVDAYQKLLYSPSDKRYFIREQIRLAHESIATSVDQDELSSNNIPLKYSQDSKESFDQNLKPSSTVEYESHGARIESVAVLTLEGEQVNNLLRGKTYVYTYIVRFSTNANHVRFSMLIKTISGVILGGGISASSINASLLSVDAGTTYLVNFRFNNVLNEGIYFLNAGVLGVLGGSGDSEAYLHRMVDACVFRVIPDTENRLTGNVDFGCYPEIKLQSD